MKNKCIKLYMKDFLLGRVYFADNKYVFIGNKCGFNQAKKVCPIIPFSLNESGQEEYANLPYPFTRFLNQLNREDIKQNLNVKNTDTDFEKLIKYATSSIEHETFWIGV